MYNIETISKLSGLSRRNIHYYVQRGIAPPPEGSGRGSYYTDEHLEILKKIKVWNEQGMPLFMMKKTLEGEIPEPMSELIMEKSKSKAEQELQTWQRRIIAPGLELHVLEGIYRESLIAQIFSAASELLDSDD